MGALSTGTDVPAWPAPTATGPVDATVSVPGSKSLTNRYLVLAALAHEPSRLRSPLHSRDTALMAAGLAALGVIVEEVPGAGTFGPDWVITPRPLRGPAAVDCGLAGTVMRFVPPVAALAEGAGPLRRRPRRPAAAHGPGGHRAARPRRPGGRRRRRPAAADRARHRTGPRRHSAHRRVGLQPVRLGAAARRRPVRRGAGARARRAADPERAARRHDGRGVAGRRRGRRRGRQRRPGGSIPGPSGPSTSRSSPTCRTPLPSSRPRP